MLDKIFASSIGFALVPLIFLAAYLVRKICKNRLGRRPPSLSYVIPRDLDLQNQSKILPGTENIHFSVMCKNERDFAEIYDPKVLTIYDNFLYGLELSGDGPCLGTRAPGPEGQYSWMTYGEVLSRAKKFGAGLLKLGLKQGQNTFVGLYSQNRWEWDVTALACTSQSMVIVPLYDTLGVDSAIFIVNQAEIELIVCDNVAKLNKLMENIGRMPSLKFIVVMDYCNSTASTTFVSFEEVLESCTELEPKMLLPMPDDLYIICYTSGTTGNPKGVMLSHRNLVTQIASLKCYFDYSGVALHSQESVISYLPMAHMFGQCVHMFAVSYGASIGFFRGDVTKLLDDIQTLKPAYLPAVPRLLNKFNDRVRGRVAGSNLLKRALFHLAFYMKSLQTSHGIIRRDTLWDWLVFGSVQKQLGGRVRAIVTGSAPVLPDVKQLSWVALGACVMEAYGQTELTAAITVTWPHDTRTGHVGAFLPNCWVKLVEVPELENGASGKVGEVCVKGPCMSAGYFKDPVKTRELIDVDGWLHTGDIGLWTPFGTLRIIDRKKDILKLAQGEYVSPEKIESIYSGCPFVAQIFVDGSSLEICLVGIVVPNVDALRVALDEDPSLKMACDKFSRALAQDENFFYSKTMAGYILGKMSALGKDKGLNSLEQVKSIWLSSEPFTMENGLLTPTLKTRRSKLRKLFEKQMNDLYEGMRSHK